MVSIHPEPGVGPFLRRTIAAQIHFAAMIAAIIGTVRLCEKCAHQPVTSDLIAVTIFGLTSIFLFATSSLYHFLYDGFRMSAPLEAWFEKLDHIAIFLFISGTYTVVLINSLSAAWANTLLFFIWSFAALGILYTVSKHRLVAWAQHRYTSTALYVLIGWTFVIRLHEIVQTLSTDAVRYLMFGGLSYSVGAIVYAVRWPNPVKKVFGFHEIWHTCVVLGYGCHYALISGFYS